MLLENIKAYVSKSNYRLIENMLLMATRRLVITKWKSETDQYCENEVI